MVKRRLAGETACPTKPASLPVQNVETPGAGHRPAPQYPDKTNFGSLAA
jgi:hypothetical protein